MDGQSAAVADRQKIVARFQKSKSIPVFLLSAQVRSSALHLMDPCISCDPAAPLSAHAPSTTGHADGALQSLPCCIALHTDLVVAIPRTSNDCAVGMVHVNMEESSLESSLRCCNEWQNHEVVSCRLGAWASQSRQLIESSF